MKAESNDTKNQQAVYGEGRVLRRTKGFYYLLTQQGKRLECKVKGQLFKDSKFDNQIAVGDIVNYSFRKSDKVGLISGIVPRSSFLVRSRIAKEADQIIAANVDYLLILASAMNPSFRLNLIIRMLIAAAIGNVKPVLVITKTDLTTQAEIDTLISPLQETGVRIISSSTQRNPLDEIREILTHNICLLAGQSGVGKSSLLNQYFPDLDLKVGEISQKTLKGAHTTTYARMFQVTEHGFVIDTPGIREFGLRRVNKSNLGGFFPTFSEYTQACKHRDCVHVHEPNCGVKSAVESEQINKTLYEGYVSVFESL